jgi:hypothetical protein
MSEVTRLDIEGKVPDLGELHFMSVEWRDQASRFVLIRYAENGKLAKLGYRLDLDKRVVLDKTGNAQFDLALAKRAAKIWKLVAASRQSVFDHAVANVESLAAHP